MLSSSGSSPKYRMGQSCRKNKRQMLMSNDGGRSVSPGEDAGDVVVAAESQTGRQDGSDCTYDGQDDMDGEAGGGVRSSGDGGGGQYVIRYEKDGEMDRMLERQAELIEQYEEEEKAQREWEKQYNENRNNADKVAAEVDYKPCQNRVGCEDINPGASQGAPRGVKVLPKASLSESPENTLQENCAQLREVNDRPDQSCAQTDFIFAQESSNTSSTITRQDEISDGDDSCFNNGNVRRPRRRAIKTPSERSTPSSDTLNSKVYDWSSSHFHDHTTDSHLDAQSNRPTTSSTGGNMDVGSVLEALQRARISLSAKLKLSRPVHPLPPSQVTLALPAPGDDLLKEHDDLRLPADGDSSSYYREGRSSSSSSRRQEILALTAAPADGYNGRVDFPVNDDDTGISVTEKSSSSTNPPREEILALPAPGDDYRREIIDDQYVKIPVRVPGLFRLPTDSFPADQRMFASGNNARGSGFSLGAAAARHTSSFRNPSAHCRPDTTSTEAPSTSGDGSGFSSPQQCYDLYRSVPAAAGRCTSISGPDFTMRDSSFGLSAGAPAGLGDADLFLQRGTDYTISNKWML